MHLKTEVRFFKVRIEQRNITQPLLFKRKKVTLTEFLGEWLGGSLTYNSGSIFALFHNGRAYV